MRAVKKAIVLVAIATTAVGGYLGYEAYNKPVKSTLLMQNIEALSQGEEYSPSECPGLPMYADVGISYMEYIIREHYADSIDMVREEHWTYCHANGIGKKEGFDGIKSRIATPSKFVPCEGSLYHTLPPLP